MQDLSTGEMVPLKAMEDWAKDEAIPIREHHGPVFTVGEVLEIRGGKFRVHAISSKRIYLDSTPSK